MVLSHFSASGSLLASFSLRLILSCLKSNLLSVSFDFLDFLETSHFPPFLVADTIMCCFGSKWDAKPIETKLTRIFNFLWQRKYPLSHYSRILLILHQTQIWKGISKRTISRHKQLTFSLLSHSLKEDFPEKLCRAIPFLYQILNDKSRPQNAHNLHFPPFFTPPHFPCSTVPLPFSSRASASSLAASKSTTCRGSTRPGHSSSSPRGTRWVGLLFWDNMLFDQGRSSHFLLELHVFPCCRAEEADILWFSFVKKCSVLCFSGGRD